MPRVLNKRHSLTREQTANAVYVGRPTKWGNPFSIGQHGDRAAVIQQYKDWIRQQSDLLAAAKVELKGKDLICWCAPLPCHADVLLDIANQAENTNELG